MFQFLRKAILTILFSAFASQASAMFIEADWLDPTQPGVGTNRYAYSNNDPVNKLDPAGNSWLDRAWDSIAGDGSFNKTFGDRGSAWSDKTFGNDSEKWAGHAYTHETIGMKSNASTASDGKWWSDYNDYKSQRLEGASGKAVESSIDYDIALTISGIGPAISGIRAAAVGTKIIPSAPVREGIYEFLENGVKYVGQSSNIPSRLVAHELSGKLAPGVAVSITEVLGGKTAREIAEHLRIQAITGGVPARFSDLVTNLRDPIGAARRYLLD